MAGNQPGFGKSTRDSEFRGGERKSRVGVRTADRGGIRIISEMNNSGHWRKIDVNSQFREVGGSRKSRR